MEFKQFDESLYMNRHNSQLKKNKQNNESSIKGNYCSKAKCAMTIARLYAQQRENVPSAKRNWERVEQKPHDRPTVHHEIKNIIGIYWCKISPLDYLQAVNVRIYLLDPATTG